MMAEQAPNAYDRELEFFKMTLLSYQMNHKDIKAVQSIDVGQLFTEAKF